MKTKCYLLTIFILLLFNAKVLSLTSSNFDLKFAADDEIIVSDSIVSSNCHQCTGQIFVNFVVNEPDYEPLSYTWIDKWNNAFSKEKDISGLCPGEYELGVDLKNNERLTFTYIVLEEDKKSPKINTYVLSNYIAENVADRRGSPAYTSTDGDVNLEIGLTCQFDEQMADDVISQIEDDLSYDKFVKDNCSNSFLIESVTMSYSGDTLSKRKIYVKDEAGNMDSIIVSAYVDQYYEPEYESIYVDFPDQSTNKYDVFFDQLDENIILPEGDTYIISADVDLVCVGSDLELKWDLDDDNIWDQIGNLNFEAKEIGFYNINSRATGLDIKNTPSSDLNFTIEVPGISVRDSILGSSCDEVCDGSILVDIKFQGEGFMPNEIFWTDIDGNRISADQDGSLRNVCSGSYELTIETLYEGRFIKTYVVPIIDSIKPNVDTDALQDFLINSILEERPGGFSFNGNASNSDSVFVGASCSVDFSEAESVFKDLVDNVNLIFNDNCDEDLEAEILSISSDSSAFIDVMNNKDISGDLFIAATTIKVIDDFDNEFNFYLVVYVGGFHSPVFNEFYVLNSEEDFDKAVTIPFTFQLEDFDFEFSPGTESIIIANVDPVCENADIELRWDLKNDDIFDHLGDTVRIKQEIPESVELNIKATSTGIRNSDSEILIRYNVNGLKVEYETIVTCSSECDSKAKASIVSHGDDYVITKTEWIELNAQSVIAEGVLVDNLCFGKYLYKVSLANGEAIIDSLEVKFDADVFTTNNTCIGTLNGELQLVKYSDTKNGSSFGWYDENENLISNDSLISDLSEGIYKLIVSDNLSSCNFDFSYEIKSEFESPIAQFDVSVGSENLGVSIENKSQNSDRYEWDFGDGQSSEEDDPVFQYQYKDEDTYLITLISFNEQNCSDTTTQSITVEQAEITGLISKKVGSVKIFPNPVKTSAIIQTTFAIDDESYIEVFDSNGRRVEITKRMIGKDQCELSFGKMNSGIFLLRISDGNDYSTLKLVKQ